jgi:hypothetical protein
LICPIFPVLTVPSNNDPPSRWRLAFYHARTRLIGLGHYLYGFRGSWGGKCCFSARRSSPFVPLTTPYILYPSTFLFFFDTFPVPFVCKKLRYIPLAMQRHEFVNKPRVSPGKTLKSTPHPLDQLSSHEIDIAREAIFKARGRCFILFRDIFAQEPAKAELVPFLEAEHSGTLTSSTPRPPRQARVQYDVVHDDKSHDYMESVIDIITGREVLHRVVDKKHQCALTL